MKLNETDNCMECIKEERPVTDTFQVVGKTYYKLYQYQNEPLRLLCYRHWHQAGEPDYEFKGDYLDVIRRKY